MEEEIRLMTSITDVNSIKNPELSKTREMEMMMRF
jgi:hypothetical protein